MKSGLTSILDAVTLLTMVAQGRMVRAAWVSNVQDISTQLYPRWKLPAGGRRTPSERTIAAPRDSLFPRAVPSGEGICRCKHLSTTQSESDRQLERMPERPDNLPEERPPRAAVQRVSAERPQSARSEERLRRASGAPVSGTRRALLRRTLSQGAFAM